MIKLSLLLENKKNFGDIDISDYTAISNILNSQGYKSKLAGLLLDYYCFSFNEKTVQKDLNKIFKQLEYDESLLLINNLYSKSCISVSEYGRSVGNNILNILDYSNTVGGLLINFLFFCFYTMDKYCKFKPITNSKSLSYCSVSDNIIKGLDKYRIEDITKTRVNLNSISIGSDVELYLPFIYFELNRLIRELMPDIFTYYTDYLSFNTICTNIVLRDISEQEVRLDLDGSIYSALRKRKYLIPTGGIRLEVMEKDITIEVFERQYNDDNYLIIFDTNKSVSSYKGVTIINLHKRFTLTASSYFYDVIAELLNFYEIDKSLLVEVKPNDYLLYFSISSDTIVDNNGIIAIKGRITDYNDYTVKLPYYWKYKDINYYKSTSKSNRVGIDKTIFISATKRRLANGSKASTEAKLLAKQFCIELEENETLVRPHVRKYKSTLI